MPYVDFTLEDIKQLIHRETPAIIEQALIKEREHTREMMAQEFMSFWDHNLEPMLTDLHNDVAELKQMGRMVNQHSKDIMELRSRLA